MASRSISLVPVTLKEAALDSPTFRGTVVHYAEQVELVERWLEGYLKATTKLCNEVYGLEELINNFLGRGVPTTFSESILDHDYTLLAMRRFAEGSRNFWGNIVIGARKAERNVLEPLVAFQKGEMRSFKETRRVLELNQAKYDALLARYSSQSKSKEPSSLREDAFQLFEARKLYIRSSFDFCIAAPTFRAALDRTLTKVLSDQWRDQIQLRREGMVVTEKYGAEMERIRAWSDGMEGSEQIFRKELVGARKELEERAKRDSQPARELEEYASSTVPFLTSRPNVTGVAGPEGAKVDSERQGWLFMRTFTGKPTRSVWLRRWFYVRGGMFGWLVQGYRGVDESEKIGVLLCNIKPAFQEERRFCFEVKTKDTSVLLQAETQAELTGWLAVFEQAKKSAVESSSSSASTQAFSIIPSPASAPPTEPTHVTRGHDGNTGSSSLVQSGGKDMHSLNPLSLRHLHVHRGNAAEDDGLGFDRSLTLPITGSVPSRSASMDISRSDNPTPAPSGTREKISQKLDMHRKTERMVSPGSANPPPSPGISALIAASHNTFPFHPDSVDPKGSDPVSSLAPATLMNTPSPGNLSKAAAVTGGNSAIDRAILTSETNDNSGSKGHKKTLSLDFEASLANKEQSGDTVTEEYPSNYPIPLKTQNLHFKMLFPRHSLGEIVLLVFRATWSPNDTQELPGRCYVTSQNIYFYSHYLGLVFTSMISLESITEIKAAPGKECDFIFLHLKPELVNMNPEKSKRVTIKIFLDPIRLLQRRLGLLVKNANTNHVGEGDSEEHKLGERDLLEKLIGLEKEKEGNATDTESWEDVAVVMDSPEFRKGAGYRLEVDSGNMFSHGQSGQRSMDGKPLKEVTRFKLPSDPVIYEPQGMDKKSVEREFEVSPKALFHVMFGDKSAVFQTLYCERRAQHIKQQPWIHLKDGKMRREFTYEIEHTNFLRRVRTATVVDSQTIDQQNDHLCYVITDRKTPWHLPYREDFMLVSKVVITHVAKSKCKLAIWTAVEWSKEPAFSKGIIERQALDDLDSDALDLGDVVAGETRKLGSHSRTKKSAYIFGQIGQETTPSQYIASTNSEDGRMASERSSRLPIKQRTLSQMIFETGLSFAESAVSSLMMWTFAAMQKGWGIVSAQRIILLFLGFSLLSNMMLTSRSTVSYWSEKRAARFIDSVGIAPNGIMSRAIYLRDMDDIISNGTDLARDSSSQCYNKFRQMVSLTDMDADAKLAAKGFSSASTRSTAKRLRSTRQHLGGYRHDLLVAMRVVNSLEKNILHAEWDNWLWDETSRCRHAKHLLNAAASPALSPSSSLPSSIDGSSRGQRRSDASKLLIEYCSSCDIERRELDSGHGVVFY